MGFGIWILFTTWEGLRILCRKCFLCFYGEPTHCIKVLVHLNLMTIKIEIEIWNC